MLFVNNLLLGHIEQINISVWYYSVLYMCILAVRSLAVASQPRQS